MNEQGSKCPNCKNDIGLWTVMKAPLPNMMRCPHCKIKLKYEKTEWKLTLLCLIIYLFIVYIVFSNMKFLYIISFFQMSIIVMVICIVIWQPFEVILALYLKRNQKLVIKKAANNLML